MQATFKRKATGSLYIYSPMGIKAGLAQVVLEDCSGKKIYFARGYVV